MSRDDSKRFELPRQCVYTLTCKRDLPVATMCLHSLQTALPQQWHLAVFDDGTLTEDDYSTLGKRLDPHRTHYLALSNRAGAISAALQAFPRCQRFRKSHPLAQKLLDVPILADGPFIFCDCDILFFRRIPHSFLESRTPFFCQEEEDGYSCPPWKLRFKHNYLLTSGLNSGFLRASKATVPLEQVEMLLANADLTANIGLFEQTAWAILFRDAEHKMICPKNLICTKRRPLTPDSDTLAIHFMYHLKPRVAHYYEAAMASLRTQPALTPRLKEPIPLSSLRVLWKRATRRFTPPLN